MQVIGLVLLTGVALCSAQQGAYQQCGGINWTGGTTCVAGWTCVPQAGNPYYSQCLAVSTTITSCTPSPVVDTTEQSPYAQCGGINWTGGTTCTAGWTCVPQAGNPYYSQCLPASSSSSTVKAVATTSSAKAVVAMTSSTMTQPAVVTTSSSSSYTAPTTTQPAVVTTSSSSSSTAPTSTAPAAITTSSSSTAPTSTTPSSSGGVTYKSSFTFYGAGDTFGSPNCQTDSSACGFFTSPGFAAAASQNLFGVGPGAGAGPACGTCWQLTGQTDSSGNTLSNAGTSIIVMVNNLCPAEGNPLCAQSSLTGTNQYGANVNFDLCEDSGAREAFFGNDGVGLALGTATQVSCSLYSGTVVH